MKDARALEKCFSFGCFIRRPRFLAGLYKEEKRYMYTEAEHYYYHYEMLANLEKILNRFMYNGCIIEQKATCWCALERQFSTLQQTKAAIDAGYQIIASSLYPKPSSLNPNLQGTAA